MIIGFTGTQQGMLDTQLREISYWLSLQLSLTGVEEAHHGLCIGGDEQFHNICRSLDIPIVGHPGNNPAKTMKYAESEFKLLHPSKPNLERNNDIVEMIDILLAGPQTRTEVLRSGTWYTIRRARKRGKPVNLMYP